MSQQTQQTQSQYAIKAIDKRYDINAPFAPGSYIELEIHPSQNQQLQWGFIEVASQIELQNLLKKTTNTHSLNPHILLDSNQEPNKQYNVQVTNMIETNKLGFSLPITRGKAEKTFDKYYIIVFVYDTNKKNPTLQDVYITIDMSFRVGVGEDKAVKEAKRNYQQTTTKSTIKKPNYNQQYIYNNAINDTISQQDRLKYFNKLEHIYSVDEAVAFLKALPKKAKKDFSKYAIQNPQIACKIAYIYYRFDLGNEDFISSVEGVNGAYQQDRQKYIKAVVEVFENGYYKSKISGRNIYFSQDYKDLFANAKTTLAGKTKQDIFNIRKEFVEYLIRSICMSSYLRLPLKKVIFEFESIEYKIMLQVLALVDDITKGKYEKRKIIIHFIMIACGDENFYDFEKYPSPKYDEARDFLAKNITFMQLLDTIFHELRHFYVNKNIVEPIKKAEAKFESLHSYIAISDRIYIGNETNEEKQMFSIYTKDCDDNDGKWVGCHKDEKQDIYEIQPSERDARYVATQIMSILFEKDYREQGNKS